MNIIRKIIELDVFRENRISQVKVSAYTGLLRPILVLESMPHSLDVGLNIDYIAPACASKLNIPFRKVIFILYKNNEYSMVELPRIVPDYRGIPYTEGVLKWRALPEHFKAIMSEEPRAADGS